ncbi:MAG: Lpg1974 family pore-forming outer membrane protein [Gemmataceae bacterium]|nr:Lpg1974 family pore-forming outer membrane protein [Gemmataceae bacterium]
MLRKRWLALAASALCGVTASANAQDYGPAIPGMEPLSAPFVQLLNNGQQPETVRSGIMGGATLYFFRPYFTNNVAYVTTTGFNNPPQTSSSQDFDWNFQVTPAVWLGWTSHCGVGFRARYLYFDRESDSRTVTLDPFAAADTVISAPPNLSPIFDPNGGARVFQSPGVLLTNGEGEDTLYFRSNLRVQTLDGEATYARECGRLGMIVSVGGRYLSLNQDYYASLTNVPVAGESENSSLRSNREFTGGGPTVSWFGRWEFGRSGLSIYGMARGSVILGTQRQRAVFAETIVHPNPSIAQTNVTTKESSENAAIPIGELEGGVEYSRVFGGTRLFIRGGVANQTYFDAGSASSRDGNMTLFGGQISIGLNY